MSRERGFNEERGGGGAHGEGWWVAARRRGPGGPSVDWARSPCHSQRRPSAHTALATPLLGAQCATPARPGRALASSGKPTPLFRSHGLGARRGCPLACLSTHLSLSYPSLSSFDHPWVLLPCRSLQAQVAMCFRGVPLLPANLLEWASSHVEGIPVRITP